jgi:hypothetical protein
MGFGRGVLFWLLGVALFSRSGRISYLRTLRPQLRCYSGRL